MVSIFLDFSIVCFYLNAKYLLAIASPPIFTQTGYGRKLSSVEVLGRAVN
jgi:hypothetical protein